ncbi:MAG: ABC transporter permease [Clostridiales bacterium]|nr:ABC transporter permease [Clostridiales bacterium]
MSKIKEILLDETKYKITVPIIAILLSFLIATIVMLLTGINPLGAFKALIRTMTGINLDKMFTDKMFNARYVGEFLTTALPITLTGLSVAFAFRTGLFNIGAEGQLLVGAMAATVTSIMLDLPAIIHLPIVILSAALAGALWGFVPGILKAKFNIHEVVVTIMMNYTALYLTNYILKALPGSTLIKTVKSLPSGTLKSSFLADITNHSRFHWGFVVVGISIVIFWYIIEKTSFGFELRSVGFNPDASKYAGMKVTKNVMLSMMIAGAFAGMAGAMLSVGTFNYGRVLVGFENYGFDGIAVALLGGNTGLGVLLSGLLFGGLKSAQPLMQANGVPLEIAKIISSLIVLFVAMKYGFEMWLRKFAKMQEKEGNK